MANQDSRVILTGFIQGQALKELYSNAYIYVLPSDLEGMPLSLLESLRKKLQELLENDDLVQRYKANATDYIVNKYNWDSVTDQTLNLYGGE